VRKARLLDAVDSSFSVKGLWADVKNNLDCLSSQYEIKHAFVTPTEAKNHHEQVKVSCTGFLFEGVFFFP